MKPIDPILGGLPIEELAPAPLDSLPWQAPFSTDQALNSAPLLIVRPRGLEGKTPPERGWIVPGWIPSGVVTGLYGDGGEGKTLLAQQLQTSTGIGKPWLGLPVDPVPSLGVYCEDEHDELFRRQRDINAEYQISFSDLKNIEWLPRLGMENALITFGRNGVGELTAFHKQIVEAALDLRARLVIFDTAADGFAGNENDRGQVRQFVSRGLGSIAIKIKGAVVLCAHPSRGGLKTNSDGEIEGDGGSTGWSNTMRSRLFLSTPTPESGEPRDLNARLLQRKKANYAARRDEIKLRWRNGVIAPDTPVAPGQTVFGCIEATAVFLSLLDEFEAAQRPVSDNSKSGNFAPRVFGRLPREQRHDYREADFRNAMEKAFKKQLIENVTYGRASDMRSRIGRVKSAEQREE